MYANKKFDTKQEFRLRQTLSAKSVDEEFKN